MEPLSSNVLHKAVNIITFDAVFPNFISKTVVTIYTILGAFIITSIKEWETTKNNNIN